ncbi:MAG: class I tRNA ligase family protein, partial [Microcystaceae cyanobacterium]
LWQDQESVLRLVAQQTLALVLADILRLLHPFMPHITEELWHTLTQKSGGFLALECYPEANPNFINPKLETSFSVIFETLRTIRNLRAIADIKPGVKVPVILQSDDAQELENLRSARSYLVTIGKIEALTFTEQTTTEGVQCIAGIVGTMQVLIPLSGLVDVAVLRAKLEKNLAKAEKEVQSIQGRLNNPGFVNKAPQEVIDGAKATLAEAQKQAEIIRERLAKL